MTTIDNIQNTILPRPFWGVDKGGNFIGFLSFIAINCLIFIVIGDKLKYDKNETYKHKIPKYREYIRGNEVILRVNNFPKFQLFH